MKKILSALLVSLSLAIGANSTELVAVQEGSYLLGNAPDYDWYYGCSPTSAGMMMGFYDINGYDGLNYDDLIPGGTAELETFSSIGLVNEIIASSGHITDFYSGDYQDSGDDNYTGRSFDCLADFMGTSQDSVDNSNGSTGFWFYGDGSRLYGDMLISYGDDYTDSSGMIGIAEYFAYAMGLNVDDILDNVFNQYIDTLGLSYGFTFEDYMAEIDAGRVVLIHLHGHTMFGYGYEADTNEIFFMIPGRLGQTQ